MPKFAHVYRPPENPDEPDYVSPERPIEDWVKDRIHGQNPGVYLAPPGTDFAAQMMAQYGDSPSAGTLMGVKPHMRPLARPPVYQNPDIYLGGEQPAPRRQLRDLAPANPNWSPSTRTTGVS